MWFYFDTWRPAAASPATWGEPTSAPSWARVQARGPEQLTGTQAGLWFRQLLDYSPPGWRHRLFRWNGWRWFVERDETKARWTA